MVVSSYLLAQHKNFGQEGLWKFPRVKRNQIILWFLHLSIFILFLTYTLHAFFECYLLILCLIFYSFETPNVNQNSNIKLDDEVYDTVHLSENGDIIAVGSNTENLLLLNLRNGQRNYAKGFFDFSKNL